VSSHKKMRTVGVVTGDKELDRRDLIEALKESEERWHFALEGGDDGVWDWNVQTNAVYFSKQWKEMLGFHEDEIENSLVEWATRVHPDDIGWVNEEVQRHLRAETPTYITEHRVRCKDGTYKWILDRGKIVSWTKDGKPLRMVGTHKDITTQKLAGLETVKEKLQLSSVLNNLTEMVGVMDPETHTILYANSSLRKIFGDDMVGDFCYRRFHGAESPCDICTNLTAAVSKGKVYKWEPYNPVTDRHYSQTIQLIRWIDGKEVFLKLVVDITDQKIAEEALRQSESNFSTFFNTIDDFLFVLDITGKILMVNDTVIARLGYTREELVGKDVIAVHPDERHAEVTEIVRNIMLGKTKLCPIPIITKDGRQIPVETRISWGKWNEQDVVFGVSKDISDLRLSEEKFSKTFQSSGALMALTTHADGRFIDVNESFLTTLGFTREEVIGKTSSELQVFIDTKERDAVRKEVMQKGRARHAEVQVRTKDGLIRHGLFSVEPLYVQDKLYLLTTMIDVTSLKKTEQALQNAHDELELRVRERTEELQAAFDILEKNERLYRNLFDNAPIGMFQANSKNGLVLRVNGALAKMLGYESPEEMMSAITDIATQIHADPENRRKIITSLEQNEWYYDEQPYFRKDGSIMTGKLAIRKVINPDGTLDYAEGIVEDNTEQKRMEEELEIRTKTLEEVNTALKVLVRQMGEEKCEIEARFVSNVKGLVLPYVERAKKGRPLDPEQQSCLNIIEMNLNEIVSPFLQSIGQLGLTPRETQIATLVKAGKTTKEIAVIIGIAASAVDTYRNKIRRKLNLNNKKINLQSHLQSIK
jgi:PAS domain S-box-containing protein